MPYDAGLVHAYADELAQRPGLAATPALLAVVAEIKHAAEQAAALERALRIGNPDAVPGTGRRSKPCKKSLRRNRCWKRHREHRWHVMAEG